MLIARPILAAAALGAALGAAAAQPAAPATMVEALSRARDTGWRSVDLADRRTIALYRAANGAALGVGCRPDGVVVLGAVEARILRLRQDDGETIVPLPQDRVSLRGAAFSLNGLAHAQENQARASLDGEEISLQGATPILQRVAADCERRLASNPRASEIAQETLWSASPGELSFGPPGAPSQLRMQCDAQARRLTLTVAGSPPRAANGQAATVVIAMPNRRVAQRGRVTVMSEGDVERITEAQAASASALLGDLSGEDGFAVGFGTPEAMTLAFVVPAQGLAGLIERHLRACR